MSTPRSLADLLGTVTLISGNVVVVKLLEIQLFSSPRVKLEFNQIRLNPGPQSISKKNSQLEFLGLLLLGQLFLSLFYQRLLLGFHIIQCHQT